MTEHEYVVCADLRTIRQTISNLREVIPANNEHVPEADYRTVMRLLHEWQDRIFAAGLITPEPQMPNPRQSIMACDEYLGGLGGMCQRCGKPEYAHGR